MNALRETPGEPTRDFDRTSRVHNQLSKNVIECLIVSRTVKNQAGHVIATSRLAARGSRLAPRHSTIFEFTSLYNPIERLCYTLRWGDKGPVLLDSVSPLRCAPPRIVPPGMSIGFLYDI